MLLLLTLACGADGYVIDDWRSPLASESDLDGDPAEGEDIYFNESWTDTSYGLTCGSCHSIDSGDTLTVDADEFNRAGHTAYNAPYREVWKASHGWDREDSDVNGAYGGQVCVRAYFPEGSDMTPDQAVHLEAFMRTQMDDSPAADDDRAQELDWGFTSWDTQDDFVAAVSTDSGWLYGSDLGDTTAGADLVDRHCGSCHTVGETVSFYTTATAPLDELIARIRKVDLDGVDAPNDRMPRLPEDRLSDDELQDLLATLTMGREGE